MVRNMLDITINPLVSQEKKAKCESGENQFELIFSDAQNINQRGSYSRNNLYPIPALN